MEFRILGPLEVVLDGRPAALGGAKQRALLGLLLLHANEVVSRDRLIDELWGDQPPETARTALQVHVSQLRKTVGGERIVTRSPGYVVEIAESELDASRFEALVAEARDAPAAGAAERLREALALWRGPALAEQDSSFARAERGRLEEQRLEALERRIDADLELGRQAELVPELEGLVHEHPLRERLRGQLMLALYRCGRQADALEVYRSGRRLLDEELGLEPGEELRRLERAILEQDPAIGAPPPSLPARVAAAAGRRRWYLIGAGALVLAATAAVAAVELTSDTPASVTVVPNSVAVIDPKSNRVTDDVPVGARPVAVAVGYGAVWVANADDGTVSRIDPRTRRVTNTIGIGADVSDIATGFGSVWVAGGNDGTLVRIDPPNVVERTLRFGRESSLVPRPVFAVATGAGAVWITRGNTVLRIDPRTNTVTKRIPVEPPLGIAVGSGSVWVTTRIDHLLRLDSRSGERTAQFALATPAIAPVVGGGSVWVAEQFVPASGNVWAFNPDTVDPTLTTSGGRSPSDLAWGDSSLWSAASGSVVRIRPGPSLVRIPLAHPATGVVVGEGAVWVSVQAST